MLAVASNQYHMREGVGHDINKCIIIVKMRNILLGLTISYIQLAGHYFIIQLYQTGNDRNVITKGTDCMRCLPMGQCHKSIIGASLSKPHTG